MKRLLRVLFSLVLLGSLATAQTATVRRNVNLRSDASTDSDIIETLQPGARLELIEPDPTEGFYHTTAPDGKDGWVWGRNIKIAAGGPGPSTATTPTTSSATPGDLFSQLMNAKKPPTPQPLIEDGTQVCGPTGDATNATAKELNTNKNRTDIPGDSDYVDIDWTALKNLPANRVNDFVGAPVKVVGFLSHRIAVESSGSGESTNCHLTGDDEVDWHMYLTNSAAQGISQAIIVETTPRTRPLHKWTTTALGGVVDEQTQVRVSGWLMFDSEHLSVVGKQRATVWEVHPITKIEIQRDGQWVDLDQ